MEAHHNFVDILPAGEALDPPDAHILKAESIWSDIVASFIEKTLMIIFFSFWTRAHPIVSFIRVIPMPLPLNPERASMPRTLTRLAFLASQ